jgi:Uma2 family endonuclease
MGEHKLDRFYSLDEFILLEQADPGTRYEYVDGQIYAMAGGSIQHGLIISNTTFRIQESLRAKQRDFFTFGSDVKVAINDRKSYLYPDAFVICGEIIEDPFHEQAVTNPCLIIEVLSKSTQDYDKTRKYRLYRMISSLQEYVLIDQFQMVVETFYRKPSGDWEIRTYFQKGDLIPLQSLDILLPIEQIYERVQLH